MVLQFGTATEYLMRIPYAKPLVPIWTTLLGLPYSYMASCLLTNTCICHQIIPDFRHSHSGVIPAAFNYELEF
jgi:hypothetical protein